LEKKIAVFPMLGNFFSKHWNFSVHFLQGLEYCPIAREPLGFACEP